MLSCNHCGIEYDLVDRVPKITQCDKIICLTCLKEAKLSSNKLNYVCHFHLSEHSIPSAAGGFSSLPEPVNLKKQIEIKELKSKVMPLEEQLKSSVENSDEKINRLKNEIDLKVEGLIVSIRKMQKEMHEKLNNSKNPKNSTKKIWQKICQVDSDLLEMESHPNSKRLQELNQTTDDALKSIKLELESVQTIFCQNSIEFNKTVKNLTCEDLIGKLVCKFGDEQPKEAVLDRLCNQKVAFKLIATIKHEKFQLIMSICEFTANNHLVVVDQLGKCLHLFDLKTFNYIKTVIDTDSQFGHLSGICQVLDNQQLCVVDKQKLQLYLLDINYKKIKTKSLNSNKCGKIRSYLDIDYDNQNGKFYLCDSSTLSVQVLDRDLNTLKEAQFDSILGYIQSMRVANGKLFISDGSKRRVHVFDTNLEHLISFGENLLSDPTDFLISNEHVYVFEFKKSSFKVISMENYELKFEIKLANDKTYKVVLTGKHIVINMANAQILIYEIC